MRCTVLRPVGGEILEDRPDATRHIDCFKISMHRGLLRSSAAVFIVVWMARCLGCEPAATRPSATDTDGDGLSDIDETSIYGTSPVLADTDGDGLSDYEEIVQRTFDPANAPLRFNPRVADVPVMNLRITSVPLISLHLTDTKGTTITFETTTEDEVRDIVTVAQTESASEEVTVGELQTNNNEITVQNDLDPGELVESEAVSEDEGNNGGESGNDEDIADDEVADDEGGPDSVLITDGVSNTRSRSRSEGVVVSFTTEQAHEIRRMLAVAQGYAETHEITASGGILQVLVDIENQGELPFQVTNLSFAAALVTGDGTETPVGNLDMNTSFNNFQAYALAPHEHAGPINFSRDFLTLDQVAAILADLRALTVRLGVYELKDREGKPYVFETAAMRRRTATLTVDFGDHRPSERFLVATNLDPAWPGITLERALGDILRVEHESNRDVGLTSVRGVGLPSSPEDKANREGRWDIQLRRDDGVDVDVTTFTAPYDLGEIILRGGDVIRLKWVESASKKRR